jgi:hypothetical protein
MHLRRGRDEFLCVRARPPVPPGAVRAHTAPGSVCARARTHRKWRGEETGRRAGEKGWPKRGAERAPTDGPQRPTDRPASSAQRWAKGARDLAHRCAQVGHTSRSRAHKRSDRPTDRPTNEPTHKSASAAHRWAKAGRSLRIGGPISAHRCAHLGRTSRSDAHNRSDRPTRTKLPALGKGGPKVRDIWPIAAHRSATPRPATRTTDRQTDRRTTTPATVDMRSTITNRTDVSI